MAQPATPTVRKIIHVDCDCFYAAVEMRDDPALRGRPVAVGGDPHRRGVIATCNYPARQFGVHSAMASSQALRRCPELVIVPPNFDKYRKVSTQIHDIFRRYTSLIEPLSLDEAYLDVSTSEQFENSATRIAQALRLDVRREVGITVSAGVGPNKFLAKVASDWRKPDGLFVIPPAQVEAFVTALPVGKISGVGRVTGERMKGLNLKTCGDLQQLSRLELGQHFGSFGERLYHLCRGEDSRPIQTGRRRKSVSVERTYEKDQPTLTDWLRELEGLLEKLKERFAKLDQHYLISGLTAKVKYQDFISMSCDKAGTDLDPAHFEALFCQLWERREGPARLLGIGARLRDLKAPQQPDLFPEERDKAMHNQRNKL
ncbi:DNA polymerase IV [Alcanivorax sp. 97CO-5]|uniref:DNA polymerase IV n=1 Tax=unclassified Alcanivorax TaxID=2638842 RepID=UPI0003E803CA|nr:MULTISPECIES: DNA polymerase IV [unclassified Alcanivorax]EUC70187.1 DNA polymerase IV [Alcanivorax sp. 97CO-5]PKG01966.1 DNA polymerase IV [Alcanivorax sp. 97CO-6]